MYVPLKGSLYAEDGAKVTQEFVDNAISKIEAILERSGGKHNVTSQWKGRFSDGHTEDLRRYLFPRNGKAGVFFYFLLSGGDKDYFIADTHIEGDESFCGLNGTLTNSLEGVLDELGMEVHFGTTSQEPTPLEDS